MDANFDAAMPGAKSRPLYWLLWLLPLAVALAAPGPGVIADLLLVVIVLFRVGDARKAILNFWSGMGLPVAVVVGVGAGLAIAILSETVIDPVIGHLLGGPPDLAVMKGVQGHLIPFLELLALGTLFGGVAEELIFRGYVIGWGARIFGNKAALPVALLSSVVFGASHLYQGPSGVISTGVVGALLAILYIGCGRGLLPAMLAHMTIDAYGIVELYVGHDFLHALKF